MKKFRENITGKEAKIVTLFDIKKKDDLLIVKYNAKKSERFSYSNIDNDKLYEGSAVEIFLDFGDKDHYLEIEVAPNNAKFIALVKRDTKALTFLDPKTFSSKTRKTLSGYKTTIILDLSQFEILSNLKFNAFRIEKDKKKNEQLLFALNPTLCGTFHKQEFFLELD